MSRIDFGNILRQLRRSRDETLEQVSEATGLSVAMLSRVERGERLPSPESVEALAKHFGLSAEYLMSETIAHRLVNRYGEASASRTAEHMTRDQADVGLLAGPTDEEEDEITAVNALERGLPAGPRRRYGPFHRQDILTALGSPTDPRATTRSPGEKPAPAVPPAPAPQRLSLRAPRAPHRKDAEGTPGIDPATEQVLRSASQATEAAAILVRREAPSLSREARLQLIERLFLLAGQTVEVLQTLAVDPDERVRDRATRALRQLIGP